MNTEYRNKLYNRIKDVFEKEDTQERQGFLEARENFENQQTTAFELAGLSVPDEFTLCPKPIELAPVTSTS